MQWSINTPALSSKPNWLPHRPSRKSSRGLVRVCVFVCSHRWVWIHSIVSVDLWVWLSMAECLRMCIYVLSGRHLFQLARGALSSANANGFSAFLQPQLASWLTPDNRDSLLWIWHEKPLKRRAQNASTHKVLWGYSPNLLKNMPGLAFLEWP